MACRWIILQHVAWEGPGLIALEAKSRGLNVEVRRLDRGDIIPDLNYLDGLVVMGGPMGAYDLDKYPFLAKECRLIEEAVWNDRPVLVVCLGAQLLASTLGANVFQGSGSEIGFGSVKVTPAGKQDPLFGPAGDSIPVFHWHGDTFDLPQGATLLASSPMYSHQAFRFGSRAYGLQFHIEPDSKTWSDWQEHLPTELSVEIGFRRDQVEQVGRKIIARFFDNAL
jgi:GMP synthase (glutamine-hydrolysing)